VRPLSWKVKGELVLTNCHPCSGRNDDYVLKLATACRSLSTDVADSHLFTLESLLLDIRRREGMDLNMLTQADQSDAHKVVTRPNAITA